MDNSKIVSLAKAGKPYIPGVPTFGNFLAAYGTRVRDLPPPSANPNRPVVIAR